MCLDVRRDRCSALWDILLGLFPGSSCSVEPRLHCRKLLVSPRTARSFDARATQLIENAPRDVDLEPQLCLLRRDIGQVRLHSKEYVKLAAADVLCDALKRMASQL